MRVTKLINDLTTFLRDYGDQDVWVYDNNCAGHYGCDPWSPLDAQDGVQPYQNQDGEQVARIETQW